MYVHVVLVFLKSWTNEANCADSCAKMKTLRTGTVAEQTAMQTPSTGLRLPSYKEGAGKRCSECNVRSETRERECENDVD